MGSSSNEEGVGRVDEDTSRRMSNIRTEDTEPELFVRRLLHEMGYRYRTDNRDLPGSPDVANRSKGWVVFVHGCFWHSHNGCSKGRNVPDSNTEFWENKFEENRKRDERVISELREDGFRVIVVWECELEEPTEVADSLEEELAPLY